MGDFPLASCPQGSLKHQIRHLRVIPVSFPCLTTDKFDYSLLMHHILSTPKAKTLKWISTFFDRFAPGVLASDRFAFSSSGVQIQVRNHLVGRGGVKVFERFPGLFLRNLPISSLLMGGERAVPAGAYARMTGDLLRPSTPISRGPHVEFLRAYVDLGEEVFSPERFAQTKYCANALRCIKVFGEYFGARTIEGVIEQARRFARMFDGEHLPGKTGNESPDGRPVRVRRIKFSDCYEVVDGNHRLAIAAFKGEERHVCSIFPFEPLPTPMQQMVMDSSWTEGICILYQPIDLPEFRGWATVRGCADRLEMMKGFLAEHGPLAGSYLDVCCSYGWFVDQMAKQGYKARGVDRDGAAVTVGSQVYGLDPSMVTTDDIVDYLSKDNQRYDVVSCFSILHHFALGRGSVSAVELIKLVDAVTGSVLFFDTGEAHEGWFKDTLPEWTPEYIADWLRKHTSFNSIKMLGTDQDAKGNYRGQYGRHLFACWRS
jgi:SAM-dependent methyltransferase